MLDNGGEMRGLEPSRGKQALRHAISASLAQLVKHTLSQRIVMGSFLCETFLCRNFFCRAFM